MEENKIIIPEEYTPISAWGYVGYSLLFSIPLVGFICLLVFAISGSNKNVKNYARSYFCMLLIEIILAIIIGVICAVMGIEVSSLIQNI